MNEKFKILMRNNVSVNQNSKWKYNFLIQFDDIEIAKKLVEYEKKSKALNTNYHIYLTRFYYSDTEQPEFKTDYEYEIELIVIESSPLMKEQIEKALVKIIDEQSSDKSDKN